jgi:hypothetical protein
MTGASIETTLDLWASSLREVKSRMRPLFAQERAALNAGLFVDGLLGDELSRQDGLPWMPSPLASRLSKPRRHDFTFLGAHLLLRECQKKILERFSRGPAHAGPLALKHRR